MAARDSRFAELEAAMQHQHRHVDVQLDAACRAVAAAVADATRTSFTSAAVAVEALNEALEDHLQQEELLVLPAVVAAIPPRTRWLRSSAVSSVTSA